MTTPTYSRQLACYYINEQHKWLLIKKRSGAINKLEQRTLEGFEITLEEISVEIISPADEALDEFNDFDELNKE